MNEYGASGDVKGVYFDNQNLRLTQFQPAINQSCDKSEIQNAMKAAMARRELSSNDEKNCC